MEIPFISIIIPVYNGSKTLNECLNAIYSSTFQDFEVLIIDDLSTDNSLEIAISFPCRIFRLEKKGGPAAARNRGAELAKGEVLFFTDSDVIIFKDTLQKIADAIKGKSALTGMYTKKPYLKKFFSFYHNYYAHRSQKETSSISFMFHSSCGAVRKEVFKKLGGFSENMKKPTVEDVEFGYRLMESGYHVYLDKDIQVIHFTNYTFAKLIKSYFYKSRDWAELLFARRDRLSKNEGWANFKNLSILLSVLLIIPLTALSFQNRLFLPFLLACLGYFIYQNHDFYKLIIEEKPHHLPIGIVFNYFVNLVFFTGICAAVLTTIRKRFVNAIQGKY